MKYLKKYKLFEAWVENPKFYRKSHEDVLDGLEEGVFKPKERRQIGSESINNDLVSRGFPDKSSCVHFMSEEAYKTFGKDMSYVWGNFLYEVNIDDSSIIAWSFHLNINDWYYRSNIYNYNKETNLIKSLEKNTNILEFEPLKDRWDENDESVRYTTDALLSEKIIGFGTIKDLKNSPHWGKYRYYCWTNEEVYLKRK
jgi:hypothetical protein